MLYPKGPEKKLFTLGPKPSGARECFSRGSDSGNGPSLGGDSISCTRRKKTQKYYPSGIGWEMVGYMLNMAALGWSSGSASCGIVGSECSARTWESQTTSLSPRNRNWLSVLILVTSSIIIYNTWIADDERVVWNFEIKNSYPWKLFETVITGHRPSIID